MIFQTSATKSAILDPEVDRFIDHLPSLIECEYSFTTPGDYRTFPAVDSEQRIPATVEEIDDVKRYLQAVRPRLNAVISLLKTDTGRGLDIGICFGLIDFVLKDCYDVQIEGSELPVNINAYCAIPLNCEIPVTPWELGTPPPFEPGSFDFVVLMEVLEHLKLPPGRILATVSSLIAPGGRLILTTPNIARQANIEALRCGQNIVESFREDLPDGVDVTNYVAHIREYTISEVVEHVEQAGLRVAQVLTCNQWQSHDRLEENPCRNDIMIIEARKARDAI